MAEFLQSAIQDGDSGRTTREAVGSRITHLLLVPPTDQLMESCEVLVKIGDIASDLEIVNGSVDSLWRELRIEIDRFTVSYRENLGNN